MKMTKVLLITASRACLAPSPYLDTHGEEDLYLHRGRYCLLSMTLHLRSNDISTAKQYSNRQFACNSSSLCACAANVLRAGVHAASLCAEAYSSLSALCYTCLSNCSPKIPSCGLCASSSDSVLCRPLYLNQQRLLRLNQLWVASAFDFDSPTFHDAFGGSAWRAAHYW